MKVKLLACIVVLMLVLNGLTFGHAASGPSAWFVDTISQLRSQSLLDEQLFSGFHENISRRDFAYLGVRLFEIFTGLTAQKGNESFSDTQDEWVLKAKHLGIVSGYPDGSFKPRQSIRRDELAHMFMNVLKVSQAHFSPIGHDIFSDDTEIQAWAKESVYLAFTNGLVSGTGNNCFTAAGNATREQALAIFFRGMNSSTIIPKKAVQLKDPVAIASIYQLQAFWPQIINLYERGYLEEVVSVSAKGTILLRFKDLLNDDLKQTPLYFAWNIHGLSNLVDLPNNDYWLTQTAIMKESSRNMITELQPAARVVCGENGVMLKVGSIQSSIIEKINLIGDEKNRPWIFEASEGDLWFSTWADNDEIYASWGDGKGVLSGNNTITDMGIAKITGLRNTLTGENVYVDPVPNDAQEAYSVNDKPSSLLYLNQQLIGQFHRPLEDPNLGYLAISNDYGVTWERFLDSPWTKSAESPFRCMFFINQGKAYELNTDGYVYALGVGKEWGWSGEVYLARVPEEGILDYEAYEYYSGISAKDSLPIWSSQQKDANPLEGIAAFQQFSAIFHEGLGRYIAMTNQYVFDSPTPWGPWTVSGEWLKPNWLGYQPGIVSKYSGEKSFWFTASGQPQYGDELAYKLCMGQIEWVLK